MDVIPSLVSIIESAKIYLKKQVINPQIILTVNINVYRSNNNLNQYFWHHAPQGNLSYSRQSNMSLSNVISSQVELVYHIYPLFLL